MSDGQAMKVGDIVKYLGGRYSRVSYDYAQIMRETPKKFGIRKLKPQIMNVINQADGSAIMTITYQRWKFDNDIPQLLINKDSAEKWDGKPFTQWEDEVYGCREINFKPPKTKTITWKKQGDIWISDDGRTQTEKPQGRTTTIKQKREQA